MYMTVSVNAISENNIIASCMKLDICYIIIVVAVR